MQKQVIEYNGLPVGIVVPDSGTLKFIAVKYHVIELDGRRYNNADDVILDIDRFLAGPLRSVA